MRTRTTWIVLGMLALLAPQFAMAVVTFDQLDDDMFMVSHRVKLLGGRGQAMRVLYEKAGSLCVAAGFTHFEILDQESQTWQHEESANASARVRFFHEGGDERIKCEAVKSDRYVEQAAAKLEKNGYRPPAAAMATYGEPTAGDGSCTAEQVSAMRRAGLPAERIEVACGSD